MAIKLMSFINYEMILFFGVFLSVIFAGITRNKKNVIIVLSLCVFISLLQLAVFRLLGLDATVKFYPLIAHLPIVLLLVLYFKKRFVASIFAIASAYLCCQLAKWLSILVQSITGLEWTYYISHYIFLVAICVLIIKYISASIITVFEKSAGTILVFGILPAAYYAFDYIMTVYSDLLYSGFPLAVEFMPFGLCIAYIVFCVLYFKQYEEKCEAEQKHRLVEMQITQSLKEIDKLRRSEYEITLLRHDMRHFLNNICHMLDIGEYEKAKAYIGEIINASSNTVVKKYCNNQLINLIISSYESRISENNIKLELSIATDKKLPCPELEFTSILSNAYENAIEAVRTLPEDKRSISIKINAADGHLFFLIKNPYIDPPELVGGLPISRREGHGFGTQSIKAVAERLNGKYLFTAKDGVFSLMVAL